MKTLKTKATVAYIFILLMSFTACKKDKTDMGGKGYYQYGGQKYEIISAALLTYHENLTLDLKTANAAQYVRIQFNDVGGILPEGTLTRNESTGVYKPAEHFTSVIFGANGLDNVAAGGTITIKKTDKGYQVTLNLIAENGELTGVYNGTLSGN